MRKLWIYNPWEIKCKKTEKICYKTANKKGKIAEEKNVGRKERI